jgi:diguanylate cyclase (GGDEF)-like protein/PAS domain S-box-containing protein
VVGIYHHDPLTVGTLCALALLWATVPPLMARRANRSALDEAARSALESSPCGSALVDATGRIVWVNTAFAAQIDRSGDSMTGAPLTDFTREDLWAELESRREELDRGAAIDVSACLVRADGEEVWVAGHARAMEPESGRLCLQLVDISSALGAQDSLAKSVAEFRQALESSNDLILMVSKHGKINYANPVATSCLAGDADLNEAVITDLVELNDRERFITALKNSRKKGEVAELSGLRLLRPDRDSDFPVAARIAGLRTPDGVGGAIVTCRLMDDQIASERELRSSEARFSRIFHSSPDAILIVRNADSTILDFNAGFIRLLGYTREDAIGQAESDLQLWVHEAERERILNNLQTDQEVTAQETKLRRKNGAVVYVELSLRYIEIEGELCILWIGRDVSERAIAEIARRQSEEKFVEVFNRSPDGIAIVRQEDMLICDINEAFVNSSGHQREDLIGESLFELDVVSESALADAALRLEEDDHFSNLEMTLHTKSGEEIPALVSATTLEVEEEPCFLIIAKDLRDLRATEEQLRASEQRFRGAFENAPIGILLVDMDGKVFQANRFAAELLSYRNASMRNLHISRLVPDDDRDKYNDLMQRLAKGHQATLRTEQRMLCADGAEIWTNMHVVLLRSQDGEPAYGIVQIADITEMKHSQQRMERMAFYDILTDLANRRLFYDRLSQAIEYTTRNNRLAALLYLDLDQFKRVNDTLGHEAGDTLLRTVAERLSHNVRQEDTVARPGGDEFTVLLYNIGKPEDAGHVAEKILKELRRPITVAGEQLVMTTSIGVSIIPSDGTDPKQLMSNADLAMYRAKEQGRNQFQFYSKEMNTNAAHRLKTENELRAALERQEFELYYQPKVRLSDLQIVGVECLLRWHHPERGLLLPGEFIEVAEETGTIVDLGKWVIETACSAATQLAQEAGEPICTAVNISPRQFRDVELVSTVQRCLAQTGLDPDNLEIEITETMLMDDVEAASATVCDLHDLGVRLAIDDFGTGYSSLNYLKKFPIDTIKVDRSFVADIPESQDDMAITAAVIAMARRLHLAVVAEGVQTREQLEFLQQHECEFAQGFLFSQAVPLEALKQLLVPNVRLLRR